MDTIPSFTAAPTISVSPINSIANIRPPSSPHNKNSLELEPGLSKPSAGNNHVISLKDVAKHSSSEDIWIAIGGEVYDMTRYQEEHPGGKKVLQKLAGKDATKQFRKYHRDAMLLRFKDELRVGVLGEEEDEVKEKVSAMARFAVMFVGWKR